MTRKLTARGLCGLLLAGCAAAGVDDATDVQEAESDASTSFSDQSDPDSPGTTGEVDDTPEIPGTTFISMPDDEPEIDVACDVWAQDCPQGEKCTAYVKNGGAAWDATKCVVIVDDPQTPGSTCTATSGGSGDDDCDISSMCWGVNEEGVGYCVSLCTGNQQSNVCEDPDTSCVIVNEGVLNLCLSDCNPLLQDCPLDSEGCYPGPDGYSCAPDVSGGLGAGEPCAGINTCAGATYCEDASLLDGCDGSACCTEFCATNEEDNCGGATECVPFVPEGQAQPGQENIGGCVVPGA